MWKFLHSSIGQKERLLIDALLSFDVDIESRASYNLKTFGEYIYTRIRPLFFDDTPTPPKIAFDVKTKNAIRIAQDKCKTLIDSCKYELEKTFETRRGISSDIFDIRCLYIIHLLSHSEKLSANIHHLHSTVQKILNTYSSIKIKSLVNPLNVVCPSETLLLDIKSAYATFECKHPFNPRDIFALSPEVTIESMYDDAIPGKEVSDYSGNCGHE
jgi:hypothetical protein